MLPAIILSAMAIFCTMDAYCHYDCHNERQERPGVETKKRPKNARKCITFRTNPRERLR